MTHPISPAVSLRTSRLLFACAAASLLIAAPPTLAQPTIPSHTIDCGGGSLASGIYRVTGAIGQPDASQFFSGGSYSLRGGFMANTACKADFNRVNGVNVQDIFDFLAAWFAGNPAADFNDANGNTIQDIFDFLAAWFAGC